MYNQDERKVGRSADRQFGLNTRYVSINIKYGKPCMNIQDET